MRDVGKPIADHRQRGPDGDSALHLDRMTQKRRDSLDENEHRVAEAKSAGKLGERRLVDSRAIDKGSVVTSQVLDLYAAASEPNLGMLSRHFVLRNHDAARLKDVGIPWRHGMHTISVTRPGFSKDGQRAIIGSQHENGAYLWLVEKVKGRWQNPKVVSEIVY